MTRAPRALPLGCRCGHVRGTANDVAPDTGFRFVCYCHDRQAFARFLARPDVLDPGGGTDIFHMPAGRVRFAAGTDAVRCLQFSGRVFRWYTECCRTPIANTAGPRFPVVGIIHCFMILLFNGRDVDDAADPRLAPQMGEERPHQLLQLDPVGLGAPGTTVHLDAGRVDLMIDDASSRQPSVQPVAVKAGFVA